MLLLKIVLLPRRNLLPLLKEVPRTMWLKKDELLPRKDMAEEGRTVAEGG